MADTTYKNRILLGTVLALVLVPMLSAWWLKASIDGSETWSTTNHGQFLSPGTTLTGVGLGALASQSSNWRLIVVPDDAGCVDACEEALPVLRALHLRLGKDARRVTRTFVWDAGASQESHLPSESLNVPVALEAGVYIADPLGNLVLQYDWNQVGNPIFDDFKHLLELSRIG